MKKCRENSVVPKFMRVKPVKCIREYQKFFDNLNNKLVMRVIKEYYRKISYVTTELLDLHLNLSRNLRFDLWETLDGMSYHKAQIVSENISRIHDSKLQRLIKSSQHSGTVVKCSTTVDRAVVNLSSQVISDDEKLVLSKGLNFAPTPKKVPVEAIITGIEETISRNHIPNHEAECLRQDIASMLRKSRLPNSNLSCQEINALKALRSNEDLLVLPADKGNATVVVDTSEYELKMSQLLSDTNTYKKVTYDPTARVTTKLKNLLQGLSDDLYSKLRPLNPTPPRIYGLPKIHKPEWPLRPIVSQIDSPSYNTARYMADMLLPLTGNTTSFVRDSVHFVQMLGEVVVGSDELMVSFDIVSLFTNIPIADTLNIISELFLSTLIPIGYMKVLDYLLTSGYFLWRGEYYLQTEGVAMGSPIAPVVANIFMEWFERVALDGISCKPRHWWRYVDDVFAILHRDKVVPLLEHLNSKHPKITFTVEQEVNGELPFLDVLVKREQNGRLSHTVYRKPTHTDRYLQANSHHHPSQLASVPRTLINRALRICDPQYVDTELSHVKSVLESNGYSWRQSKRLANSTAKSRVTSVERAVTYLPFIKGVTDKIGHLLRRKFCIKTIFRPPTKIRQLLRSPKDNIPLGSPGVYMIPCDCGECYIGETGRNVSTRLKEHIRSMKNADSNSSAVAEHALSSNTTHFIRFDKARILSREKFFVPRKIREAIEISRRSNFNRDRGWALSQSWKTCFHGMSSKNLESVDTVSFACRAKTTSSSSNEEDESAEQDSSQRCLQHQPPPPPPPPPPSARALRAAARSARCGATTAGATHSS